MDVRDKLVEKEEKRFGQNVMFKMAVRPNIVDVKTISTGSLALDNAIGVGGFPRGRIIEIYGPEATGKSMLSLSAIAHVQSIGGYAAFIDAEHALSPQFAKLIGVNIDNLYYSQPDDGETALGLMEDIIGSGLFDIVVLDSVAALVTEAELDGSYSDNKVAPTAILMAKALKRMTTIINKTKTAAIFINQLREKPMVMFGSPEYTPGGRALKFYTSIRADVRMREKFLNQSKKQIAHIVEVKVVKNKIAPPFGVCNIKLDYTSGIDKRYDIIETAKELGIIQTKSSYFYFGDKCILGSDSLYNMDNNDFKYLKSRVEEIIWGIKDSTSANVPSHGDI